MEYRKEDRESFKVEQRKYGKSHSTNIQKKNGNEDKTETIKAIQYIGQLRHEEKQRLSSSTEIKRLEKEIEVGQIGQSWQSRLSKVMQVSSQKNFDRAKGNPNDSGPDSFQVPLNRVSFKFLPSDLSKLTSIQVLAMLKSSVLYDKGSIKIFKQLLQWLKAFFSFSNYFKMT